MILKKLAILVIFIHVIICMHAQDPEQKLNTWAQVNPIEKVYLHVDRTAYISGQTLWFKAYFLSEYVPSIKNSTLYVELLDEKSTVIIRKTFPCYMGVSLGQIDIPENFNSGTYQLRAYSPLMLNQPGFVYSQKVNIFGATAKQKQTSTNSSDINLQFFPEGGHLITGLLNNVAFKAVDENGYPVNISGQLKNNKGAIITTIITQHDGMGKFALVPQSGESYNISLDRNAAKQFTLPASTTNGITFSMQNTAKGKQFRIGQLPNNPDFKVAYMIGQMQNNIIFKQNFSQDKEQIGGLIETSALLSGILQVTIFNKDNIPLAERLTFIDNKEYILPGDIIEDTINTGTRQRNHFSIALKDTIIGSFSVSVTDATYDEDYKRPINIYSYFLLNSDLKGYIHNPAYYFSSDADSIINAMDLVMMTNGWSRFNWTDVVKNTLPLPPYKDPGYIHIGGTVNIEGTRKPFANKDLLLMISPVDTLTQAKAPTTKIIETDSTGKFSLDSMIFYDNMRILFADTKGKKSKFIKVKIDADSIGKLYKITPVIIPLKDSIGEATREKMTAAYEDYTRAEGITLGNVTVRARQKSEREKLEETYTSGLFSGGINDKVLDLTKENATGLNIFEYLQSRVPGITIGRDAQGQYEVRYRDFGGMGSGRMALYLDEMQTDATFIESIPVNQIALVKVMGNFLGAPGGGGALAVYMKKGTDLNAAIDAATDIITYKGYSIIKEFYQPNYSLQTADQAKTDNRLTLLWNPDIYLANVSPTVPVVFYNNDRTQRFNIVVEGVTRDGRFLMLEKTIGNKK